MFPFNIVTSPKAKAIVAFWVPAILAIGGELLNLNLVSGTAQHWVTVALGAVTAIASAFGVYQQPNADPPAAPAVPPAAPPAH